MTLSISSLVKIKTCHRLFSSKTLRHLYDKSDILRILRNVVRFESGSRATSCLSRVFKRSTKYIFVTVYVINYILYIIVSCTMRCNHILSWIVLTICRDNNRPSRQIMLGRYFKSKLKSWIISIVQFIFILKCF